LTYSEEQQIFFTCFGEKVIAKTLIYTLKSAIPSRHPGKQNVVNKGINEQFA
jgi:hypothetical protein